MSQYTSDYILAGHAYQRPISIFPACVCIHADYDVGGNLLTVGEALTRVEGEGPPNKEWQLVVVKQSVMPDCHLINGFPDRGAGEPWY